MRLISGTVFDGDAPKQIYGLHVAMDKGWKTYWRAPGDAGGFPPVFDWSRSVNLSDVTMRFPAPHRYEDAAGLTIGYKEEVVFPIDFEKLDPSRSGRLVLNAEIGVCLDICVPVEANLALDLPTADAAEATGSGFAALIQNYRARLPQRRHANSPAGSAEMPIIEAIELKAPNTLLITARFDNEAGDRDAFVETADQTFVPLSDKTTTTGSRSIFEITLTSPEALEALRDKTLIVTLASDRGQSETVWPLR